MTITIKATYENGVFRPAEPLPLREHEQVELTIESGLDWADRTAGILKWTGDQETLRRIALTDEEGIMESP